MITVSNLKRSPWSGVSVRSRRVLRSVIRLVTHKGSRNKSEVAAFANTLATELSTVGNTMVMPALSAKIKDLFGFEFSDLLEEMGGRKKRLPRRKTVQKRASKRTAKKKSQPRK